MMRRSCLFLLLFLLAIGGSMHAQQVLFICSPQLPCPGFSLGSVQAGIDQNGWRNFKLTLTQNVTSFSFVGTPPPAQAAVNVIFTQDATGGRTVAFASNISNPCTITTSANATTLCQFEYDGIAGIWIGISGGGSGINGAGALGTQVVGTGSGHADQTRPVLDARDYGVKGDGVTDDTTAMQNAINAACNSSGRGTTLIIPQGFNLKISSTLTVTKCAGLTIDGQQAQGQATIAAAGGGGAGNAAIQWFGSVGGTVLTINQTRDSSFRNFTVFSNASNYHNSGANIGILVDEIAPVTSITTNNEFYNVQIYNGNAQNSNFIGIDVCPTAPANCETQNFDRLFVQCGGGTVTASSNGVGLKYEGAGGAQAFYEYVHWMESSDCSQAIDIEAGNEIDLDGGLTGGNYTDLQVNGGRNISYRHFRSELGTAQIVIGTAGASSAHDLTIEENSFAGLTNSTTTISFPFNNTGGLIRVIKNDWDSNATVTPFGPTGGGAFVGVYESELNNYPNSTLCPVLTSANMYYFNMDRTACASQYTQFGGTSIAGVKIGGLLAMYNSSNVNVADFFTEGNNYQMISEVAGNGVGLSGDISAGTASIPAVSLGNSNNINNTTGYAIGVALGAQAAQNAFLTFSPSSGTGDFVAAMINPTINQTGSASGNPTALGIYPVNTAVLGTAPLLIGAGSASSVGGTRTNKFTVDNSGNVVTIGRLQTSTILTVGTLPTCNAGLEGSWSAVSDATAPTYNAALTGSGTVHVPVYCNGSAWTSH